MAAGTEGVSEAGLDIADGRAGSGGDEGASGVAEVVEAQRFEPDGADGWLT